MKRLGIDRNIPIFRLMVVLAIGFISAVIAITIALDQPDFSVELKAGDSLQTSNGPYLLTELDFTQEPGEIKSNLELKIFFKRQGELSSLLDQPAIVVLKPDKAETQHILSSRYAADLPFTFWFQIAIGLGSLAITGWVWSLRPGGVEHRLFVLSGLFVMLMTFPAAVYSTRELALSPFLFKSLWMLNAYASSLFGISLVSLLLVYPTKLNHWRTLMTIQTAFFLVWTFIFSLGLLPVWANVNLLLIVQLIFIVALIAAQYLRTSKDPTARASLLWLGLSIFVCTGAFMALNTIPILLNLKAMEQSYAFSFVLILYLGLAAGIKRYRLFEVGEWAFRFLFYAVAVLLFVLLDVVFIYFLKMDRFPALGIGLIAIGFLYLPLRDILWTKYSKYTPLHAHELLEEVLFVAMASPSNVGAMRWEDLLKKLYDPLEIKAAEQNVTDVEIQSDGLVLVVPAVANSPALKLSYPFKGTALYTLQSRGLATQMVSLIKRAESSLKEFKAEN